MIKIFKASILNKYFLCKVAAQKGILDICYLRKTVAQYHTYALENWKNNVLKIAIFLDNMAINGNVSNIVNTLVRASRETINAILSYSNTQLSSSISPATLQTDNRRTNVTSPIGSSLCNTDRNNRRFDSPAQELSTIFRRGGNLTFQRGINHRPQT